jgi:hypothetical protein
MHVVIMHVIARPPPTPPTHPHYPPTHPPAYPPKPPLTLPPPTPPPACSPRTCPSTSGTRGRPPCCTWWARSARRAPSSRSTRPAPTTAPCGPWPSTSPTSRPTWVPARPACPPPPPPCLLPPPSLCWATSPTLRLPFQFSYFLASIPVVSARSAPPLPLNVGQALPPRQDLRGFGPGPRAPPLPPPAVPAGRPLLLSPSPSPSPSFPSSPVWPPPSRLGDLSSFPSPLLVSPVPSRAW